jgi:hypothetical protein
MEISGKVPLIVIANGVKSRFIGTRTGSIKILLKNTRLWYKNGFRSFSKEPELLIFLNFHFIFS